MPAFESPTSSLRPANSPDPPACGAAASIRVDRGGRWARPWERQESGLWLQGTQQFGGKSCYVRPPRQPDRIPEPVRACLEAIARSGLGHAISIGGAFGLAYYHEYRETHDVAAWWLESAGRSLQQEVQSAIEEALRPLGTTRVRRWGDVVSIELMQDNRVTFSFQVAERSVMLHPPLKAPWPHGLLVDALQDLVASKMVALVAMPLK